MREHSCSYFVYQEIYLSLSWCIIFYYYFFRVNAQNSYKYITLAQRNTHSTIRLSTTLQLTDLDRLTTRQQHQWKGGLTNRIRDIRSAKFGFSRIKREVCHQKTDAIDSFVLSIDWYWKSNPMKLKPNKSSQQINLTIYSHLFIMYEWIYHKHVFIFKYSFV